MIRNNKHINNMKAARRLVLGCLMFLSLAGNAVAQYGNDSPYVIKKRTDGADQSIHYLAHIWNGSEWVLQDTTAFSPSCLWYSGPYFNHGGSNHNYYFYDGAEYRFLAAPLSPGADLQLSDELPETHLLGNTDQNYYFYDWDKDSYGRGVARGHRYYVDSIHCTHNWEDGQCWEVYWVEYDLTLTDPAAPKWKLTSESSYGITTNAARYRQVTVTENPIVINSSTGGLASMTLTNPVMEYSSDRVPTISITDLTYNYRPAYNTYVFEGATHNYYNTDLGEDVPGNESSTEAPASYEWTLTGPGAAYLSFASDSQVNTSNSTSPPTVYYRVCNNTGDKEATLTLTVTFGSGASLTTQTKSVTITVKTPCQNPGGVSAEVTYEDVTISWAPTADSYTLSWKKSYDVGWQSIDLSGTSHTLTGLDYDTEYQYTVKASCDDTPPANHTFRTKNRPQGLVYGAVFGGGRMGDVGGRTEVVIINCDSLGAVYGGNDIFGAVADSSTIRLGINAGSTYSHDYNNDSASINVRVGDVYGGGNGYYAYNGSSFVGANAQSVEIGAGVTVNALSSSGAWNVPVWKNESSEAVIKTIPTIATTHIYVTNNVVKVDSIFGGAKNAFLIDTSNPNDGTNIFVNGGTVFAVFGGNNYGGNQATGKHHIIVNATTTNLDPATTSTDDTGFGRDFGIRYIFGGGNKVNGLITDIQIKGGQTDTIFGGGNLADVTRASVLINCPFGENTATYTYGKVYSTAIESYSTENITVLDDYAWSGTGLYNVHTLFGGNNDAPMRGLPTINLYSGSVGTVYGGGNSGDMQASELAPSWIIDDFGAPMIENVEQDITYSTHVVLYRSTMLVDYVYGGCQMSSVDHSTIVEIKEGHVGSVFGGCNISGDVGSDSHHHYPYLTGEHYQYVNGATYVKASGGTIYNDLYAGGNGYYHCNDGIYYIEGCLDYAAPLHYYGMSIPTHNETHVKVTGDALIKGNVYAGGNMAPVGFTNYTSAVATGDKEFPWFVGFASVRMDGGEVMGDVYGGGNMASIYGSNEVQVSGGTILGALYGGNDHSGQVAQISNRVLPASYSVASDGLTSLEGAYTYVSVTGKPHISTVYGGGNGDYVYDDQHYCDPTDRPIQNTTFVDINIDAEGGFASGGHIDCVYGGGNGVTVTDGITVLFNVVNEAVVYDHVDTIFGGNNKGALSILPDIILLRGRVNTVYGGCKLGAMKGSFTIEDSISEVGSIVRLRNRYTAGDSTVMPTARVTRAVYGGCLRNDVDHQSLVIAEGGNHGSAEIFGGCDVSGHVTYSHVIVRDATPPEATESNAPEVGYVFGGGDGYDVYLSTSPYFGLTPPESDYSCVDILGGKVDTCIYGGGNYATVRYTSTVNMSGGELGWFRDSLNVAKHPTWHYIYAGGCGAAGYPNIGSVGDAVLNMSGGRVWGSIFGGGQDSPVLGDATTNFTGGIIGSTGFSSADGNIFGGGRGFTHVAVTDGRVEGNVTVNMSGDGMIYGNIYGGGRLGNVGIDGEGHMYKKDPDHGHVTINISGGEVGRSLLDNSITDYDPEFEYDPSKHTDYLMSDAAGHPGYLDYVGHVFGGGMGLFSADTSIVNNFGRVVTTEVNIQDSAFIFGNVYGGGRMGKVTDSTYVYIAGGTVQRRAFAGGRGVIGNDSIKYRDAGDVRGNSRLEMIGGAVKVCVYGGAETSNVEGDAHVILKGGEVGRKRDLEHILAEPTHCYVFGSGQGDPHAGNYNTWTNVRNAYVVISDSTRVWGSVFGGGEDGHVLQDIHLEINLAHDDDTIGSHGYSGVDGNIFSGGRGFNAVAPTAGGTGGNIYTHIHGHGHILGSVFGGGRVASTGIHLTSGLNPEEPNPGDTIPDTPTRRYGYTQVIVEGDVVIGYDYASDGEHQYLVGDIGGNVCGGAKGMDMDPNVTAAQLADTATLMQGRMGHVKATEVIIRGNAWVKGSVYGGGEEGRVWKDTRVVIDGNAIIGVDRGNPDSPMSPEELQLLEYSGNVFGGSWGSATIVNGVVTSHKWIDVGRVYGNTNIVIKNGHIRNSIYGGGSYASVGDFNTRTHTPKTGTGLATVIMQGGELGPLDMSGVNAYVFGGGKGIAKDWTNKYKAWGDVFNTHVIIRDTVDSEGHLVSPRILGSVFGGAEDGHVLGDARTDVLGGTLGTTGFTTWDGNIFGGGRNYSAANYAAGRVGGNITINVKKTTMCGSVYGGGRTASVGVNENGEVITSNPNDHGQIFVNITGPTLIGPPMEGHYLDSIRGNVYGGCMGIVALPAGSAGSSSVVPSQISNVINTYINIYDSISGGTHISPSIRGSVYGGSQDGHVLGNTDVIINGGNIGEDETTCLSHYHGNVFGGGRGLGRNASGQFSSTAGTVNGNTSITITGGHIFRNVYGGGYLASVGLRGENFGSPDPNTGWARIKISGGVIGTDTNKDIEHGNVFGSCRGVAGSEYQNFAYVNNTLVTLTTATGITPPVVKGSVYGSGEDGHVLLNTQVTINGGQVGMSGVNNTDKGNVFGGGRGIDLDSGGNLSPTAGWVRGNTKVTIQRGDVYGNVFGGGNISGVGHVENGTIIGHMLVDVLVPTGSATTPTIHGNVYGGSMATPESVMMDPLYLNNCLKTVNVRGGHIIGNVYGCSYNSLDGIQYTGHQKDWTSFVNIDGGLIDGNVYGAGWVGEVTGSVCVNIGANAIAFKNASNVYEPRIATNTLFNDNGGTPIVAFGHVRDISVDPISATFTGFMVDEGAPVPGDRTRGFCWSTSHNPTIADSKVEQSFAIGDVESFTLTATTDLVSGTGPYYVRAFATNGRGTYYSPEVQFTMAAGQTSTMVDGSEPQSTCPPYEPAASNLRIGGSVFGGCDYTAGQNPHMNDWLHYFGITGYANVYIDGTGYDTESATTTGSTYMNIAGGLYASGTHCESGAAGRDLMLRNYGHRSASGNGQLTSSTRTLTTIQRCGNLLLDNANINISGMPDLDVLSPNTGSYAVLKVDSVMYLANASSLTLSHESNMPTHMDSIHCLRSVHLHSGSVYDNQFIRKLDWEWIGIRGATGAQPYMCYTVTSPTTPLDYAHENVILFNQQSRLWVRYNQHKTIKFGELQGFIRMLSPFDPYGLESFAYARPKITNTSHTDEENNADGGFLSYEPEKNFFEDDHGASFTDTIQYPYYNVLQLGSSKNDRVEYREWLIPRVNGHRWYVDGRPDGWGSDQRKIYGWGLSPDKPKKTIFGAVSVPSDTTRMGGICIETATGLDFSYKNDVIFIVGALSDADEAAILCDSADYPLKLYRYPGGHPLSWAPSLKNYFHFDIGGGTPVKVNGVLTGLTYTEGDINSFKGPGANYGPLFVMDSHTTRTLDGVLMDGLYGHRWDDDLDTTLMIPGTGWMPTLPVQGSYSNPPTIPVFDETAINAPMIEAINGTLTLQGGTELRRGFNNHDVANLGTAEDPYYNFYLNADFNNKSHDGDSLFNGGALYVGVNATVNVNGLVTIRENYQKKGTDSIPCNVYLSTFNTHLNINDALSVGTRIGVTSPNRSNVTGHAPYNYRYNTFSPVAVGTRTGHEAEDASNAWINRNFYDDLGWFFVNGHSNAEPRTTYYAATITDYPATTGFTPANTLFFGWTWNNVVRRQPDGYATNNINSAEDLAWLISLVNGLNSQTANSLSTTSFAQTDDIDLEQYVWLPIGSKTTGSTSFGGTYDGQGHLIKNLSIDYIGMGDRRYERTVYGLFGDVENGTINRTFAVSGLIRPTSQATIGGLVGTMNYTSSSPAMVKNSESAVTLYCPNTNSTAVAAGGLVGNLIKGEVLSCMAMDTIHASSYYAIGGLVGATGSLSGGGSGGNTGIAVNNSFANMMLLLETGSVNAIGGLIGDNRGTVSNCYTQLQPNSSAPAVNHFGILIGNNRASVTHCAGYDDPDYELTLVNGSPTNPSGCYRYTSVMDADNLGYMYYDNTVTVGDKTLALYKWLNQWVAGNNSTNKYSYWSRPAITEINNDLPVLQLCNGATTGLEGNGDFSSLATYNNGVALQYGGTVRDGSGHQLSTMLGRSESVFVYGDVAEDLSSATVNASKVSIYEHAAIMHPGSLAGFNNTYVGISFDNSHVNGVGSSSIGVNFGLGEIGMGPYPLPRDWHMFSSPLSDAPLGFNYMKGEVNTNEQSYSGGNSGTYYNNPWVDLGTEFSWLQSNGSDNIRYWMYGWTNSQSQSDPSVTLNTEIWRDGYFPSQVGEGRTFGTGCIEGSDEEGRYPYGMDFYTWNEPQYHWINFKRNGPNHWHSDPNTNTGLHDHLDYVPVANAVANVNETNLIVGRGYMAAICDTTFMQSHGCLNAGTKTIALTNTSTSRLPGWNLLGNPYHAYLDFEQFVAVNGGDGGALGQNNSSYFYVVYDADGYSGVPQSAYLYYPSQGSSGGAYAGRYLHPHQGFYVLAKDNNHSATFNEGMLVGRTLDDGTVIDGHFRGDNDRPAYPLVNLFLSSENGCHDITVIEFERPEWGGARKMRELRMGNGIFYAQHDNTHYAALFAKRGTERVPLWFEAKEDDMFTITWNTANGDFHSMWLIDNLTGVRYDMIENDSYTFQGHVGDYPSRFYIVFNVTGLEEQQDEGDSFVFFDGSEWVVTGEGVLDFIDTQGQVLWSSRVNGVQNRVGLPQVACGVYFMRLTNSEGTKVQKIVVMR